jgi:hypothetical protein
MGTGAGGWGGASEKASKSATSRISGFGLLGHSDF